MGAIFSVLVSPKQTFEKIRENGGGFLVPFLLLIVGAVVSVYLQLPVLERMMDAMEQQPGVDPEMVKTIGIVTGFISAPFGVAAGVFITGLLLLLVNLIIRGDAKYMDLVKVGVLSSIPSFISSLLVGVLARVTDAQSVAELTFGLGAFMEKKEGVLFSLANIINPFSLWSLAIMVIGTAVMARRPVKSAAFWIIGGWLLITGIFAAIGGLLS